MCHPNTRTLPDTSSWGSGQGLRHDVEGFVCFVYINVLPTLHERGCAQHLSLLFHD